MVSLESHQSEFSATQVGHVTPLYDDIGPVTSRKYKGKKIVIILSDKLATHVGFFSFSKVYVIMCVCNPCACNPVQKITTEDDTKL